MIIASVILVLCVFVIIATIWPYLRYLALFAEDAIKAWWEKEKRIWRQDVLIRTCDKCGKRMTLEEGYKLETITYNPACHQDVFDIDVCDGCYGEIKKVCGVNVGIKAVPRNKKGRRMTEVRFEMDAD